MRARDARSRQESSSRRSGVAAPADDLGMDAELPPLSRPLGRLPWFWELTPEHRSELATRFAELVVLSASDAAFTALLERWALSARQDMKWSRLELLRQAHELEPPRAA